MLPHRLFRLVTLVALVAALSLTTLACGGGSSGGGGVSPVTPTANLYVQNGDTATSPFAVLRFGGANLSDFPRVEATLPDGQIGVGSSLSRTDGAAIHVSSGALLVSSGDQGAGTIHVFDNVAAEAPSTASRVLSGFPGSVTGIVVDGDDRLFVALLNTGASSSIGVYDGFSALSGDVGAPDRQMFGIDLPLGLALSPDHTLYVTHNGTSPGVAVYDDAHLSVALQPDRLIERSLPAGAVYRGIQLSSTRVYTALAGSNNATSAVIAFPLSSSGVTTAELTLLSDDLSGFVDLLLLADPISRLAICVAERNSVFLFDDPESLFGELTLTPDSTLVSPELSSPQAFVLQLPGQ